jgi:CDP-diacylglycerol--glycerol-3-phosphate 3-phosphatidyltransferase
VSTDVPHHPQPDAPARPPRRRRVLDRQAYLARWSGLHGGVAPRGLVGGWLRTVYVLARPLARLGVAPGAVTLGGLLLAAAALPVVAAGGRWILLGVAVIVASATLDGVDGAVAVVSDRTSRWGTVLDHTCDRLADLSLAGALGLAGAPIALWLAGGALALLHEQVRASAAAAGMPDVGVVTVSERPTRVIVSAAFLLGAGLYPGAAADWATLGAAVLAATGLVGFLHLAVVVRRRLR